MHGDYGYFLFPSFRVQGVHGQAAFVDSSETTVSTILPSSSSTLQHNSVPVSPTSHLATPLHKTAKFYWNIAIPHDVTPQCSNIWMYESKTQTNYADQKVFIHFFFVYRVLQNRLLRIISSRTFVFSAVLTLYRFSCCFYTSSCCK